MSRAFKCDLCGVAFDVESEGLPERAVASERATIEGKEVDVSIIIKLDAFAGAQETHVCNESWKKVMQAVKAWVNANI